jgi:hypothetical protein
MADPVQAVEGLLASSEAKSDRSSQVGADLDFDMASVVKVDKASGAGNNGFWETKLVGASETLSNEFKQFMGASKKMTELSSNSTQDVIDGMRKATEASKEITKFQIKFSLVNGLVTAATGSLKQMLKT